MFVSIIFVRLSNILNNVISCFNLILPFFRLVGVNVNDHFVILKYISGRCIGGCNVYGPPLSMSASDIRGTKGSHFSSKAKFQLLDQLPFDQVVQLGEHTLGKPFRDYVADQVIAKTLSIGREIRTQAFTLSS